MTVTVTAYATNVRMGFAQSAIESLMERRYVTMGRAFNAKLLVVVHTDRGDNIRIISARLASRREPKFYEESIE